jgi:hypothetical protein
MTLCIAAGNADQIIQVNDRRITAAGALVYDSVSKSRSTRQFDDILPRVLQL